jgi:peroxiredoxin Q/BCP
MAKAKKTYNIGEGDPVPDFKIESTSGELFKLSEKKGKKVVLYFYPKDATPGCTVEGHDFTKLHPKFKKKGVEVYGISRDSLASHQKFIEKQNYCFDLLSDTDEKVCKIFDVIQKKNMYGKMVQGIERSTFLIDEKGRILKEWRKVKVEGHAQEVLDSLTET